METSATTGEVLAYEVRGTGTPVVFLHGLTFDRTVWQPIASRMGEGFSCVTIDLPGHGESTGTARQMLEVADAVHELLDGLGYQEPVMVGHSLGAMLATTYAGLYPVAGVVNVDQGLNLGSFLGFLHQMEPALRGEDFASAFEPFRRSIVVEMLPEPLRSSVTAHQTIRQDLVLAYWDETLRTDSEAMQERLDTLLDTIRVPYLVTIYTSTSTHSR